jgi:hypothetical protein
MGLSFGAVRNRGNILIKSTDWRAIIMRSFQKVRIFVLSFFLISACSTLTELPKISSNSLEKNDAVSLPALNNDIPFPTDNAFFPIEKDLSGVYYSWRECSKKFIICFKWEHRKVSFLFSDPGVMKFFKDNDFGFKKRQMP